LNRNVPFATQLYKIWPAWGSKYWTRARRGPLFVYLFCNQYLRLTQQSSSEFSWSSRFFIFSFERQTSFSSPSIFSSLCSICSRKIRTISFKTWIFLGRAATASPTTDIFYAVTQRGTIIVRNFIVKMQKIILNTMQNFRLKIPYR